MRSLPLLVLLLGLTCLGCPSSSKTGSVLGTSEAESKKLGAISFLADLPSVTLYSLRPQPSQRKDQAKFHGWDVLGKRELSGNDVVAAAEAIQAGIEASAGDMARCFEPRHGIRGAKDGRVVDLVICFACSQVQVVDGKTESTVAITGSPKALLDKLLDAEGIARDPG